MAGEGIKTGFDEGWRDEQLIFVMQNQTNKGKKGEMEGGPLRCKAWPYLYNHFLADWLLRKISRWAG